MLPIHFRTSTVQPTPPLSWFTGTQAHRAGTGDGQQAATTSSSLPQALHWTGICCEVKLLVTLLSHQLVDDIAMAKPSVFTDFVCCREGVQPILGQTLSDIQADRGTMQNVVSEQPLSRHLPHSGVSC